MPRADLSYMDPDELMRHRMSEVTDLLADQSVWGSVHKRMRMGPDTADDGSTLSYISIQCRSRRNQLFCLDIEMIVDPAGDFHQLLDITMYRAEDCSPGREFNFANSEHLLYDMEYDGMLQLIRTLNGMIADGVSFEGMMSRLAELGPYNREQEDVTPI